ncbi:hypothetical protein AVEN_17465-1 [Araneus ventricosus]|uniref:Uncharacterized protein n=1 Tax=Araneus ventricosus TaxID=182803 RepID=A0A4Y2WPY0_ARAVE|nr:hypothetical protein AVEN_17465-1 [Araneus ventricosus]
MERIGHLLICRDSIEEPREIRHLIKMYFCLMRVTSLIKRSSATRSEYGIRSDLPGSFDACALHPSSRAHERKLEVRRRSDTALVLTINDASQRSGCVPQMTRRAASGKPKLLGSGGSMVAKLKLKGIDGRAPPEMEPAA